MLDTILRFIPVRRLIADQRGLAMLEYGLVAVAIALVVFLGAKTLGTSLSTLFGTTIVGSL